MKGIYRLLFELHTRGGSDLHLSEGQVPRVRIHGTLTDLEGFPVVERHHLHHMMGTLLKPKRYKEFLSRGDLDFAWEWRGVARFRCNYLISEAGL
ncbi:MAG: type IV pili twitching motility protein PilT, partial [Myxococcota bacterium]